MTGLSEVDGNTPEGVSATRLWMPHYRGSEAKRSDGVIRDPWAVTLYDATAWKIWAGPPLDRVGFMRRIRPSTTLLEFGS
jgi:O-methyltransferase involved in polyketide biosynthesis